MIVYEIFNVIWYYDNIKKVCDIVLKVIEYASKWNAQIRIDKIFSLKLKILNYFLFYKVCTRFYLIITDFFHIFIQLETFVFLYKNKPTSLLLLIAF